MKKQILYSLVLLISLLIITQSCKKGQDDPLISLHSRNDKLIGEWKLTKSEVFSSSSTNYSSNNDQSTTMNFDGTTMTEVRTKKMKSSYAHIDTTWTTTYSYSYTLIVNKDGTYKMTKELGYNNEKRESEGIWFWRDGEKNKNQFNADNTNYILDRLTNKEMEASYSSRNKYSHSDTTLEENIYYGKYSFEKQ